MDNDSILTSIKKLHGIGPDDTSFDTDLIVHINSKLRTLTQLGVGPSKGFYIQDATTTWLDFVPDPFIVESVKSFVYVKVKLVFDPPASPTVVDALKDVAREEEWRIVQWVEDQPTI